MNWLVRLIQMFGLVPRDCMELRLEVMDGALNPRASHAELMGALLNLTNPARGRQFATHGSDDPDWPLAEQLVADVIGKLNREYNMGTFPVDPKLVEWAVHDVPLGVA